MSDDRRPTVFVSYSWDDKDDAAWVAEQLIAAGYDVWRDDSNARGGEPVWPAIADAISRCDCYLLLVSESSLAQSSSAGLELEIAFTRYSQDRKSADSAGRLLIVPFAVKQCEWLKTHPHLALFKGVDFMSTRETAFDALRKLLPAGRPDLPMQAFTANQAALIASTQALKALDPQKVADCIDEACQQTMREVLGPRFREIGDKDPLRVVMESLEPKAISFELTRLPGAFSNRIRAGLATLKISPELLSRDALVGIGQKTADGLKEVAAAHETARQQVVDLDLPDTPEGKVFRALTESVVRGNPIAGAGAGAVIGSMILPGVGTVVGGLVGAGIARLRARRSTSGKVGRYREAALALVGGCMDRWMHLASEVRDLLDARKVPIAPIKSDKSGPR